MLFAAGDDGVGGFDARTNMSFCGQSNPTFPSSSPYVTSVGGTQFSQSPLDVCGSSQGFLGGMTFSCSTQFGVAEVASSVRTGSRITTGGGFSREFPQPTYQSAAVQSY